MFTSTLPATPLANSMANTTRPTCVDCSNLLDSLSTTANPDSAAKTNMTIVDGKHYRMLTKNQEKVMCDTHVKQNHPHRAQADETAKSCWAETFGTALSYEPLRKQTIDDIQKSYHSETGTDEQKAERIYNQNSELVHSTRELGIGLRGRSTSYIPPTLKWSAVIDADTDTKVAYITLVLQEMTSCSTDIQVNALPADQIIVGAGDIHQLVQAPRMKKE